MFDIHAIKLSTKLANSHIQGDDGEESGNNGDDDDDVYFNVDDDVDSESWGQLESEAQC